VEEDNKIRRTQQKTVTRSHKLFTLELTLPRLSENSSFVSSLIEFIIDKSGNWFCTLSEIGFWKKGVLLYFCDNVYNRELPIS